MRRANNDEKLWSQLRNSTGTIQMSDELHVNLKALLIHNAICGCTANGACLKHSFKTFVIQLPHVGADPPSGIGPTFHVIVGAVRAPRSAAVSEASAIAAEDEVTISEGMSSDSWMSK